MSSHFDVNYFVYVRCLISIGTRVKKKTTPTTSTSPSIPISSTPLASASQISASLASASPTSTSLALSPSSTPPASLHITPISLIGDDGISCSICIS